MSRPPAHTFSCQRLGNIQLPSSCHQAGNRGYLWQRYRRPVLPGSLRGLLLLLLPLVLPRVPSLQFRLL